MEGFLLAALSKRSGDLQWRIVHGALATGRFLARTDPGGVMGTLFVERLKLSFMCFCYVKG